MRPLSVRNPRVARLARLARRPEERAEQRALLVEGPTLIAEAIRAGLRVREIYVAEDSSTHPAVSAVLAAVPEEVEAWTLPRSALERAGDVVTSQGIVAVVDQPESVWPHPDEASLVLVLAGVADPGNVGTIIRSAVAAGTGRVGVFAGGVDPSSPKVVRASAGSWFATAIVRADDPGAALDRLAADGYALVGTVVRDGTAYDAVDLTGPVALVVGNEAHGLDAATIERLHHAVTIPMPGPTESLNVAMASTVVGFEVLRQRRARTAGS